MRLLEKFSGKSSLFPFLGKIIGSWFVSPVLSGIMSVALFACVRKFILNTAHPLKAGLYSLPVFYGVTLFINIFSIVHDGPERKLLQFYGFITHLILCSRSTLHE